MNIYVSGHNWSAKVDIDAKSIDKSDWYSEACTRAIESVLDQEEKNGVQLKIENYDDFGLGVILLTWDEKNAKNIDEHRVLLTSNVLANAGRWEEYKFVKDYEEKCK
ncbi:MAG: hypothetical protein KGQ36_07680, partial [Rickettsiales bacterium]|nr:hypothetical protein [Rickettsiales bacterium]